MIDYGIDKLYSLQKKAKHENRFKYVRARYIILLLANTGLRIEESATHRMGDIYKRNRRWILSIVGKGRKPREIELLPEFMKILKEFREDIGLSSPAPVHNEKTALIPRENFVDTISARRIDQILDWAFGLVANEMKQEAKTVKSTDTEAFAEMLHQAPKLEAALAHWLRHSHAAYYLKKTGNLKSVMERHGHADVSTTVIYQHVLDSYNC